MKVIQLNQNILDKDGVIVKAKSPVKVMEEIEGKEMEIERLEEKVVTLGAMLCKALLRNDGGKPEEEVVKRYNLNKKIYGCEAAELTDEELVYLRGLVCEAFEIFFAGQILELLDNVK